MIKAKVSLLRFKLNIVALFGLSGLIGVYFWRKGDQSSPEETLLGIQLNF